MIADVSVWCNPANGEDLVISAYENSSSLEPLVPEPTVQCFIGWQDTRPKSAFAAL